MYVSFRRDISLVYIDTHGLMLRNGSRGICMVCRTFLGLDLHYTYPAQNLMKGRYYCSRCKVKVVLIVLCLMCDTLKFL